MAPFLVLNFLFHYQIMTLNYKITLEVTYLTFSWPETWFVHAVIVRLVSMLEGQCVLHHFDSDNRDCHISKIIMTETGWKLSSCEGQELLYNWINEWGQVEQNCKIATGNLKERMKTEKMCVCWENKCPFSPSPGSACQHPFWITRLFQLRVSHS